MAAIEQADRLLRIGDLIELSAKLRVAAVDQSGAAKSAGYSSTSAWLRSGGRTSARAAAGMRRDGRQFRRLAATVAAMVDGAISQQMGSVIASACEVLDDDGDAQVAEQTLLNLARDEHATVEKVARAGKYLRQVLDPDGHLDDDERAWRGRYMTAHLEPDGSISGSFRLPPESAARLQALLDRYARRREATDTRTQSQRNADVLIQLLVQAVTAELLVVVNAETLPDDAPTGPEDAAASPTDTPASPADEPAPRPATPQPAGAPATGDWPRGHHSNGSDTTCDDGCPTCGRVTNRDVPGLLLPTGHPLPAPHVRRLATTSTLFRMVVDAAGKVLDLGAATRLVPAWMRRAVLATYDTCAYDDCPIPAKWAEMDHVRPWATHHRTRLEDVVPACDHHNRDRARQPHRYTAHQEANGRWRLTSRCRS